MCMHTYATPSFINELLWLVVTYVATATTVNDCEKNAL